MSRELGNSQPPTSASHPAKQYSFLRAFFSLGILAVIFLTGEVRNLGSSVSFSGTSKSREQHSKPSKNIEKGSAPKNKRKRQHSTKPEGSPACHPHFHLALPGGNWSFQGKFERIYFYHTRKAGGTSLADYFKDVALRHGLEYLHREWVEAEEPGTFDQNTFYVTHLREPIARSISHFKYQGRWNCRDLTHPDRFTPTENNANKLESWNQTGGHNPTDCVEAFGEENYFHLGECAVNCYTQWFSGLSCPDFHKSTMEQYAVAKERLLRYNFIVILEKLRDPDYVSAVEEFFGVPGVARKKGAYCERASHRANKNFPLVVKNETLDKLTKLNDIDIRLYNEMSDCLDSGTFDFPSFDPGRFASNVTMKREYEAKIAAKVKDAPTTTKKMKNEKKKRRKDREKESDVD